VSKKDSDRELKEIYGFRDKEIYEITITFESFLEDAPVE